jgi:phosphoribosyl-ATP pyrophosphohydrolase
MSLILRLYQTQCTTKDGEIALLKASQEATELSCSAKDNQLQQLRADMADAVVVYLFVALSLSLSLSLCADRRQSR